MGKIYKEGTSFIREDYTREYLEVGEYENCIFKDCDFSDSSLSNCIFIDCLFESCNLSLVKLTETAFQNIRFRDNKMLGLHFDNCNKFGLSLTFDGCNLMNSVFYQLKLKKTIFKNCNLKEADFTSSDLFEANFHNCDLSGTLFDNTNLEKADFRTSFNYSLDPERNRIKKAKFSIDGLRGLLYKYDIIIE